VRIRDDGRGFDPAASTSGFGIVGMRERVTLLGGTVDIESEGGKGTLVRAVIPAGSSDQPEMPATGTHPG
jgi:signal transduction histidine kinase